MERNRQTQHLFHGIFMTINWEGLEEKHIGELLWWFYTFQCIIFTYSTVQSVLNCQMSTIYSLQMTFKCGTTWCSSVLLFSCNWMVIASIPVSSCHMLMCPWSKHLIPNCLLYLCMKCAQFWVWMCLKCIMLWVVSGHLSPPDAFPISVVCLQHLTLSYSIDDILFIFIF